MPHAAKKKKKKKKKKYRFSYMVFVSWWQSQKLCAGVLTISERCTKWHDFCCEKNHPF
jgi:hypothetical protein